MNVKIWSLFSQNSIFEIGSHNFSKSYEPIFFKFCTLLLYNIFYCLNEGFFFSILSNFSRPWRVQILLKNGTFGSQLRQKCKLQFFFFLRSSTSYKHLRTEIFRFFNFRWICHELSWLRWENFFLRVTGDEVPITEFSKFFNKNYTNYLSNMYLLYGKLFE